MKKLALVMLLAASAAFAQPGHGKGGGGKLGGFPMLHGIPPDLAQKIGVPPATVKKIEDQIFEANQKLIPLEGDVKLAKMEMKRAVRDFATPEEKLMALADKVSKAELAVKKNRLSLLVAVKKQVGPQAWEKLEAELMSRRAMKRHGGGPGHGFHGDDDDDDDRGPPRKK